MNPVDAGFFKIANRTGGGVVSGLYGGTENDTTIHLWQYLDGYLDQDWSIMPVLRYYSGR
jgi:hypothetical protein